MKLNDVISPIFSLPSTHQAVVYTRQNIDSLSRMSMNVKMIQRPIQKLNYNYSSHVLVQVKAVSVNPVDAKYCVGDKFPEWMSSFGKYIAEGKGVGFDFAGVIVESSQSSPYKVGDEVYGTMPPFSGSFSEYIVAPIDQISFKPQKLTFTEAASLPLVGLTSLQCLQYDYFLCGKENIDGITTKSKDMRSNTTEASDVKKENDIINFLLIGASGGVGHIALQVAKIMGIIYDKAINLICICSHKNHDFVMALGASKVIDYTSFDGNCEQFVTAMKESVSNDEFDLVFDCVSSTEEKDMKPFNYRNLIRENQLLKPNAKYITIGGSLNEWFQALMKRTIGFNMFHNHNELFWVRFPESAHQLEELRAMVDDYGLKPHISNVLPFTEEGIKEAFELLHSRRVTGKIVINLSQE